jgi:hypothetical protein
MQLYEGAIARIERKYSVLETDLKCRGWRFLMTLVDTLSPSACLILLKPAATCRIPLGFLRRGRCLNRPVSWRCEQLLPATEMCWKSQTKVIGKTSAQVDCQSGSPSRGGEGKGRTLPGPLNVAFVFAGIFFFVLVLAWIHAPPNRSSLR